MTLRNQIRLEGAFAGILILLFVGSSNIMNLYLPDFPYAMNFSFLLIILVCFLRLIFSFRWTVFEGAIWPKLILMFGFIPLFMYVQQSLQQYLLFLEIHRLDEYVVNISALSLMYFSHIIHLLYVFSAVGAMLSIPVLLVILVRSIRYNLQTKKAINTWTDGL